MKLSKVFAALAGLIGVAIAAGAVYVALNNLDTAPQLVQPPEEALERTETMMEAVSQGDFTAASEVMYGKPNLGVDREPADEVGVMIWELFLESISYEFTGDLYATEEGLSRNITIESLDISSVTVSLRERAQTLLAQRVEEAEDVDQIYNDEGEYREEFVMEVLYEAVEAALAEDAQTVHWEITLNLIYNDEQWWILPEQTLLEAISGGIVR